MKIFKLIALTLCVAPLTQSSQDDKFPNFEKNKHEALLQFQNRFIKNRETRQMIELEVIFFAAWASIYASAKYFANDSSFFSIPSFLTSIYGLLLSIKIIHLVYEKNNNTAILKDCCNTFNQKEIKLFHQELRRNISGNIGFDDDFIKTVLKYRSDHLEDRMKTNKIMQSVGALITQGGSKRPEGTKRNALFALEISRLLALDDADLLESSQARFSNNN